MLDSNRIFLRRIEELLPPTVVGTSLKERDGE
jgi:hypothetical protein